MRVFQHHFGMGVHFMVLSKVRELYKTIDDVLTAVVWRRRRKRNKAVYTAILVACGWTGAVISLFKP